MPGNHIRNAFKSHIYVQVKDELVSVNGVAYLEGKLKIAHLRILITLQAYLQASIKFKISRRRHTLMPENLIPGKAELTADGNVRKLTIPISEFRLGTRNGGRLRQYLQELSTCRLVFGTPSEVPSEVFSEVPSRPQGRQRKDTFDGLIADYDFPQYSRNVEICLSDSVVKRLTCTEEGYFTYSSRQSLSITNKYTLRIYWLICSWKQRGGFVISLEKLRSILALGPAYDRYDNIMTKIITPAYNELKECSSIWFEYRLYGEGTEKVLVFKIKIQISEERKKTDMQSARDICFNLLSSVGATPTVAMDILAAIEYEDLRPFLSKLSDITSYISTHRNIKDINSYIATSLTTWHTDWLARYR